MKESAIKDRHAIKITNLFKRGLGFKVTTTGKAMRGNVLDVNLSSAYIGPAGNHDIDSNVARGFKVAVGQFRKEKQTDTKPSLRFTQHFISGAIMVNLCGLHQ